MSSIHVEAKLFVVCVKRFTVLSGGTSVFVFEFDTAAFRPKLNHLYQAKLEAITKKLTFKKTL